MDIVQPGLLYTLAMFALVIGILVFIHEMGHYLAGRMFGVKAESFSIGFGKELFGWTDRQGTRWKLSALPLGGYVKFVGDMNVSSQPSPEMAAIPAAERRHIFAFKPLWQRAIIVAAGPITNFVFAIGVFAAFIAIYGHMFTPPVVSSVEPNSAAAEAGIQKGDRVIELGGRDIDRFEDLIQVVTIHAGMPLDATIERGGQRLEMTVVPKIDLMRDRFGNEFERGLLGVRGARPVIAERSGFDILYYAVDDTILLTRSIIDTLIQVITGRRSVKELGGPLKIAQFSGQQATMGLPNFVHFMALISINLGFINLLPVPMLDGGHLFLYAIEGIRRRPLHPKVQEWAFMSGFALLISLMLFLTFNDLASFGVFEHLAGLLG
ncbi:RIP metalloprotease RseP [Sphingoaurantiacus capsulatus]|uniref:Zinc metalloprotease n=1 Tax=Sphingoaurantiacus capsulatus TaxID=1771310 RepID=A0ABV7XEH7_9SPHN